jgi:hypothetical protein
VADLLQELSARAKSLSASWTSYSVLGSFLLYLCGYLALRFHLTMIGIATDLAVLDERYLFTGARFLVYLTASVPSIVIVALPLWALGWGVSRLFSSTVRSRARAWISQPSRMAIFGIVFSVLVIQLVMRQCFVFSNLLLAKDLPSDPGWLVALLLDDQLMPIYFGVLVASCALTLGILAVVKHKVTEVSAFSRGLLLLLAAVQILLLPINYGVLIVDKSLPRVSAIGDKPLANGQTAWLVWESKEHITFLIRDEALNRRFLLTVDGSEVKRMEIVGFDRIVPTLFAARKES